MKIEVSWTGEYPCLCFGSWQITIDGNKLPIPENRIGSDMGTFGTYQSWHFDGEWNEVFESYDEGDFFETWIDGNKEWIDAGLKEIGVELSDFDYRNLYDEISASDWRSGSCGGCI